MLRHSSFHRYVSLRQRSASPLRYHRTRSKLAFRRYLRPTSTPSASPNPSQLPSAFRLFLRFALFSDGSLQSYRIQILFPVLTPSFNSWPQFHAPSPPRMIRTLGMVIMPQQCRMQPQGYRTRCGDPDATQFSWGWARQAVSSLRVMSMGI